MLLLSVQKYTRLFQQKIMFSEKVLCF